MLLLTFYGRFGRVSLPARVALTPEEHATGFANRASIGLNEAIFFVFSPPFPIVPNGPTGVNYAFTMAETYVPLDIMFLDGYGEIVGMYENAQPLDKRQYVSPAPYFYAIEVPGGWFGRHGISANSRVSW